MTDKQSTDTQSKILTLADIEVADDTEYAKVPGFKDGQVFCIASVTAGDVIEWHEANEGEAKRTAGLRLIVKSLVDGEPGKDPGATGKRILSMSHLDMLRKKTHKVTERLVKAILDHNGFELKKAEAKKD